MSLLWPFCYVCKLNYSSPPHRQCGFNTEKIFLGFTLSLLHAFMFMQYWIDDDERINERDYSPKEVKKRYEAKLDNNCLCKFTICEYIRERLHCCVFLFSSSSMLTSLFFKFYEIFSHFHFIFNLHRARSFGCKFYSYVAGDRE